MRNCHFMKLATLLLATVSVLSPQAAVSLPGSPRAADMPAREAFYYNVEWRLISAGRAKVEWIRQARDDWQVNVHLESAWPGVHAL